MERSETLTTNQPISVITLIVVRINLSRRKRGWGWWNKLLIPALRRMKQDYKWQARLSYIVKLLRNSGQKGERGEEAGGGKGESGLLPVFFPNKQWKAPDLRWGTKAVTSNRQAPLRPTNSISKLPAPFSILLQSSQEPSSHQKSLLYRLEDSLFWFLTHFLMLY